MESEPNTPLDDLVSIGNDIFARWDADQRPGKLLLALLGEVKDYDPRVDRLRDALARASLPPMVSEAMTEAFKAELDRQNVPYAPLTDGPPNGVCIYNSGVIDLDGLARTAIATISKGDSQTD